MATLRDDDGLVVVRPLTERDASPYAAAFRDDPDLGRLLGLEDDVAEDDALERIDGMPEAALEGRFLELAVQTPDLPFAGSVTVLGVSERHRRCEIGYWLVREARGQGVGRRAIGLLVDWLFDEVGMERIEIQTFPDNEAAQGLARSLGFVEEGVMRARNLERGVRVDLALFALLRDERGRG
jgi:RimJ/RimL family protein N-acetyltransferase